MSDSDCRYFGFVDLRSRSQYFRVLDSQAREIISQRLDASVIDLASQGALVAFGSKLASQCTIPLDAVALIVSADAASQMDLEALAVSPIPIFKVTELLAASHVVPSSWKKFQLINCDSGMLWLVNILEGIPSLDGWLRLTGPLGALMNNLSALGFKDFGVIGEKIPAQLAGNNWSVEALGSTTLVLGAMRALRQSHGQGIRRQVLSVCGDHQVLSVCVKHPVFYSILHAAGSVFSLDEPVLGSLADGRPVLFVVDQNVDRIYGDVLTEYSRMMECAGKVVFEASEIKKTAAEVTRICGVAAELEFPRHGILIAVGGGVTLDVAGLAASLYRRGISYLRVPTTLVGLIDAGLGIKQAVNFMGKKNLIGTFYAPLAVINDSSFLRTLPLTEISCGIAEIIKIALVKDRVLFELLEQYGSVLHKSRFTTPPEMGQHIISRSAMLMIEELQPNLYEADLCRLVDFGHTFSPTIEASSEYQVPHGNAVAMDMLLSTAIAVTRALCPSEILVRLMSLFECVHLPDEPPPCSLEQFAKALLSAVRHRGGNLNLVVPTGIGQAAFLQEVSVGEIEESVALIKRAQFRITRTTHASVGL